MRFLIDNALSPDIAAGLRAAAHDAVHVRDYGMTSATDSAILDTARTERRIVVSADSDFGMLLAFSHEREPSVILLRHKGIHRPARQLELLLANVDSIALSLSDGCIAILEEGRIRTHRLPIGH